MILGFIKYWAFDKIAMQVIEKSGLEFNVKKFFRQAQFIITMRIMLSAVTMTKKFFPRDIDRVMCANKLLPWCSPWFYYTIISIYGKRHVTWISIDFTTCAAWPVSYYNSDTTIFRSLVSIKICGSLDWLDKLQKQSIGVLLISWTSDL